MNTYTDNFKKKFISELETLNTTLFQGVETLFLQACDLVIYVIGNDVFAFNALIGKCKVAN